MTTRLERHHQSPTGPRYPTLRPRIPTSARYCCWQKTETCRIWRHRNQHGSFSEKFPAIFSKAKSLLVVYFGYVDFTATSNLLSGKDEHIQSLIFKFPSSKLYGSEIFLPHQGDTIANIVEIFPKASTETWQRYARCHHCRRRSAGSTAGAPSEKGHDVLILEKKSFRAITSAIIYAPVISQKDQVVDSDESVCPRILCAFVRRTVTLTALYFFQHMDPLLNYGWLFVPNLIKCVG